MLDIQKTVRKLKVKTRKCTLNALMLAYYKIRSRGFDEIFVKIGNPK